MQRRFDFQAEDLEQILRWVKRHIRWGIGDDRKRQGLPGSDNSWSGALNVFSWVRPARR
jgi:exonuclease V gamma subunit